MAMVDRLNEPLLTTLADLSEDDINQYGGFKRWAMRMWNLRTSVWFISYFIMYGLPVIAFN